MGRFIKKLLVLLMLAVGAAAVLRVLKKRRDESMPGRSVAPQWPPLATTTPAAATTLTPPAAASDWVVPVGGQCPDGYPIKVNTNSGIYHVPDGRSYARTLAQRCYATAETAERDGYRRAKA